jgi:nucleotide-binding universal stress UspA family protein
MSRFHNILVAVDFSQTSDDALAVAAEMSRTSHAQVHLLHVVPSVFQRPYGMEPVAFDFSGYLRQSEASARARLPELVARHQLDPALLTIAVRSGPPADEIVAYAEDQAIDLIVLGAHGHGFLDRLLIGSVAERVARRAPCSVLLVPHASRRLTAFEVKAAAGVES